ncbi:MAG: serine hydrolase domain-containing protein [Salinibacter sp.]
MPRRLWLLAALCLALAVPSARAQLAPTAEPAAVGLSADRLARISDVMRPYVKENKVAGLMTMVYRRGEVAHFQAYGERDRRTGAPMTPNTLFRIYSMTKPITTVAALMLYEEGHFQLDDPVAEYLSAFEGVQVYDTTATGAPTRVPPRRPMTIQDLMRHTSGLTYGVFGDTPVDSMYRAADLLGGDRTLAATVDTLATLPLLHQPGTRWHYSVSTDVLGRLVEVVSGQSLDTFLRTRILGPLGMDDTTFEVPTGEMDRFATSYARGKNGGLVVRDRKRDSEFAAPVTFLSGGGGLVSTMDDYLRFARMLLNGGAVDGTRLLSPKTVALMTQNHLDGTFEPGWGFGLGVQVATDLPAASTLGSEGMYGWSGLASTYFFVDPKEKLIGMVWTQFVPNSRHPIGEQFRVGVYQSIVD